MESFEEPCCHPVIIHRTGQSELKGEDVLFVEHCRPWPGSEGSTTTNSHHSGLSSGSLSFDLDSAQTNSQRWVPEDFAPSCTQCGIPTNSYSVYCVFDGHNGVHAAKMAADAVLPLLESRLPWGAPPPSTHSYFTQWREWVQQALVETMVELNHLFAQRGIPAGCTATMVLQVGWLITCVNIGDSRAMLDTGGEILPLSADHRVATHKGERRRVEAMGAIIAPLSMLGNGPADDYNNGVGPLRIWPGGLCLSRAIGDFDVGDSVIPFPQVTQVLLPPTGGRIIIASDGVWDAFDKMNRVSMITRSWPIETTASRMIQTIVRAYGGLKDDTTLVVVDVLSAGTTFAQVASGKKSPKARSVNGDSAGDDAVGGGCLCFGGGNAMNDAAPRPVASSQSLNDLSVKSGCSASSNPSVRPGMRKCTMLAKYDVAAIMGLMPDTELEVPGWYTAEIGESLFKAAASAMSTWREVHDRRFARPVAAAVPSMPKIRRKTRPGARNYSEDDDLEGTQHSEDAPSQRFKDSTAVDQADYAKKFGHYKTDSNNQRQAAAGNASVRAGQVFYADSSVRAGTASSLRPISEDPSVRFKGSDMDKSVHVRVHKLAADDDLAPVRVVKLGNSNSGKR